MTSENTPPERFPPPPPDVVAQAAAAIAASDDEEEERAPEQSNDAPRSKSEASAYAGSYRPSDVQAGVARVLSAEEHFGFDSTIDEQLEAAEHDVPPPAYSDTYGQITNEQDGLGTAATVADDGRVNIRIHQKSRRLSNILVPALRHQLDITEAGPTPPPPYIPPSLGGSPGRLPPPPLNVVIHVVGSRGDVQPFVALGKVLKETYGHRVRLATHPVFKGFVEENGLEFFTIGGDPSELMAFMVKNPGLMPGFDTLRSGDVGKRRKNIAEMVKGCWRSCIESGDGTGVEASDQAASDFISTPSGMYAPEDRPFVADAIIANPPSFAHIHCAERLGIPLHMMFTMPWSPTQAFPHPLANIQSSNADASMSNFISYALVDMLTWQGLGDVINRFRVQSLGLEPISLLWAPGMLARLRVPYTYCWSPALIPKPRDWGNHISISGFYFLSLASNYTPDPDLQAFLDAGPPPVYIGFGSIVVDDPNAMTRLIFDAVVQTGQRALVSKGWGGFGADQVGIPEGVFMLGNVPHDWLFKRVSCVVHHGGAGTTAAGIACGRPTVVVPFFGDQPFWGAMVARAGAGPTPIPHKQLTADNLAAAILEALKPSSVERAKELSAKISEEKGTDVGAQSFHQMLDVDKLRCSLLPSRAAVWRVKRTEVRLSALAAATLAMEGKISFGDLKLYRPREYAVEDEPWDPITGGAAATMGTLTSMMMGVADFPKETLKALKIHPDSNRRNLNAQENAGSSPSVGSSGSTSGPSDSRIMSSRDDSTTTLASSESGPVDPKAPEINVADHSVSERTPTASPVQVPMSLVSSPGMFRSSMAQVLSEVNQASSSPAGSGSRSPGHRRSSSRGPDDAERPPKSFHLDTAMGTGKGVSRIVGAGLKAPMDISLGIARGFHNAPKLYGDDTVRPVGKVTGFQSGLKTATKEFGLGFYDGVAGLVTQPVAGLKKEGAGGFLKGVGKGIAGLVLKPAASIYGIPGYAMKGVYAEIQKHFGASVNNYIIAARTAQGYEDYQNTSREEREEIVRRWISLQRTLKKKKNPGEEQLEWIQSALKQCKEKRPNAMEMRKSSRSSSNLPLSHTSSSTEVPLARSSSDIISPRITTEPTLTADPPAYQPHEPEDVELEEAIRQSVAQTSRGNAEEDQLIERAIRASVSELQQPRPEGSHEDDTEALNRAIRASIAEASQHPGHDADPAELEEALRRSVLEQQAQTRQRRSSDSEWDESEDEDEDEDEQLKRAIEQSMLAAREADQEGDREDEEVNRAMEESRWAGEAMEREEEKKRTEEEIVLEYVKKQSLAEEEHRRALLARGGGSGEDGAGAA